MKEARRDNHVTVIAGNLSKKQRTLLEGYKMTNEKHNELDYMSAMALYRWSCFSYLLSCVDKEIPGQVELGNMDFSTSKRVHNNPP